MDGVGRQIDFRRRACDIVCLVSDKMIDVDVTGRRRLRLHHSESAVDAFLLAGQGLVGRGRGRSRSSTRPTIELIARLC